MAGRPFGLDAGERLVLAVDRDRARLLPGRDEGHREKGHHHVGKPGKHDDTICTIVPSSSTKTGDAILRGSLRPRGCQYVHLSADIDTAREVGSWKSSGPVTLEVDAASTVAAGVAFYLGNERALLADSVPVPYLRLSNG